MITYEYKLINLDLEVAADHESVSTEEEAYPLISTILSYYGSQGWHVKEVMNGRDVLLEKVNVPPLNNMSYQKMYTVNDPQIHSNV